MKDDKSPSTIMYMIRHYLTANITDPLSEASRGDSNFIQYFSGTGVVGQVNYLERKPATNGRFIVKVGGVKKTPTTDYVLSSSALTITWVQGNTAGTDNISVEYQAIKSWVYDDNPQLNAGYFPRISVLAVGNENEDSGQGIYSSYTSGPGQYILKRIKIIVRNRRSDGVTYTYGSVHYKNYDLVLAISEAIEAYLNAHVIPPLWKFWRWKVIRSERVYSEEDTDAILRRDITVDVGYYRGEST